MGFPADNLKLRKHISETAVKNVLYKAGEPTVSVPADNNNLICLMNEAAHVLISIPHHTLSRRSVPAAEAPDARADFSVIRENTVSFIL